jgi:hypothetical protein
MHRFIDVWNTPKYQLTGVDELFMIVGGIAVCFAIIVVLAIVLYVAGRIK